MGVWVWSGYSSFLSDDSKRCIRFWICPKLRDRQWNVCMPCEGLEVIYCLASCYVVTPEAPVGIKWVKQWMDARISTPVALTRRTGALTFCSFFSSLAEVSVWGEYHIQCRYHSYTTLHRMWANLFVLWRWKCFIEISVINLHSCLWGEVNFWLDPRTKWQKQSKARHSASDLMFQSLLGSENVAHSVSGDATADGEGSVWCCGHSEAAADRVKMTTAVSSCLRVEEPSGPRTVGQRDVRGKTRNSRQGKPEGDEGHLFLHFLFVRLLSLTYSTAGIIRDTHIVLNL